jgi:hypothetical protein
MSSNEAANLLIQLRGHSLSANSSGPKFDLFFSAIFCLPVPAAGFKPQISKKSRLLKALFYKKHRYRKTKNRLLKFCYVPATSAARIKLLFFLFLLRPFTVLMKETRQAVGAINQSIY